MHVPITLAGRLFGVLTAMHEVPGRFGEDDLRRLAALGVGAAGAIAHALEFEHERRIARALTAGFVPEPPDPQTGLELGLVYEPVAHEAGGGDVFGVWTLPSLAVAVLIGDVSGKGLEVAAASAMVRYFVEARAWDTESPAEVLAQTNRILRTRLRRGGFATAFLAVVDHGRLRYCNAGHPPPCLLREGGESEPLPGSGLPLGVEDDGQHEEREVEFHRGDVLFAATDGLLEVRRERRFFGDDRLPELLSAHGRTTPPQQLAERVFAEAQEWAPVLHDDVVVLALRRAPELELRDEPASSPAARALYAEYQALVRERLGEEFEPTDEIFASERAFEEERAGFVVLYARGIPVACGGYRSLGPEVSEIKRMFVTAGARHQGHARRVLAELEWRCKEYGARRIRLLSTEVLRRGARAVRVGGLRGGGGHARRRPPRRVAREDAVSAVSRTTRGQFAPLGGLPRRWESSRHGHVGTSHPAQGPRGRARRRGGVGPDRRARLPQRSRGRDRGLARRLHLGSRDGDRLAALRVVGAAGRLEPL